MNPAFKIIFILLWMASIHAYSQVSKNIVSSLIKNESGLKITPILKMNQEFDQEGASYCSGSLFKWINDLETIGISANKLERRLLCTVGDFDGNGYLDIAFWGIDTLKKTKENNFSYNMENYLVLFFDENRVIRKIKIITEKNYPLVYYKPRIEIGKYGEPISLNDALWTWGESNGYDDITKGSVYIFNKASQKFIVTPFGGKND